MVNAKSTPCDTARPRAALPGSPARAESEPSKPFSPALEAGFGLEIELPSVDVTTGAGGEPLRRGSVLLHRPAWKLECDDNGGGKHDLEFVTQPLGSRQALQDAMREITSLTDAIRAQAVAGNMTVRLKSVASDATVDATLKLNDAHLPGRLQATYGVGLDHVGMLIDELLPRKQAERIHARTQAIALLYAGRTGSPLPPRAASFIRLINMYIARAQSRLPVDGTVHIFFRMMARSDFCSMFAKLLSPEEQEAVRTLFMPKHASPASVPMMMEALDMADADRLLFARPYNLADRNPDHRREGPSIKDWLASIIDGRQEGPLHKDLLSPPPGYRLHSGDLSTDYGMGAMGVDERNGLILFEIRGAPYRPQHVTMNGQLARAADNEFAHASRHNARLETSKPRPLTSAKYGALNAADEAYAGLRNSAQTLRARAATLDARDWKFMGRYFDTQLKKLAEAREAIVARTGSSWGPGLVRAMDELYSVADELLRAGQDGNMHDVVARLDPLMAKLQQCEHALWEAGRKRA